MRTQKNKFVLTLCFPILCAPNAAALSEAKVIGEGHAWSQTASAPYTSAPQTSPKGMVLIPEGQFEMGCKDCNLEDALPLHSVYISSLWVDETPVTNSEFAAFIAQTHYSTIAERPLDPKAFPQVPKEDLVPGSAVFSPPSSISSLANALVWWKYVPGANWSRPEGPSSQVEDRALHPVVQVAFDDAKAYCAWAGKRLPSEAEFEYAARGGLQGKKYAWGDSLKKDGKWVANIWQGILPISNAAEDGYKSSSPVKAFPPNGYGLYDMGGNVWQWTADWYRPDTYARDASKGLIRNPQGPSTSLDPDEPGVSKRVQRGGSFLCSDRYCTRYLVGSRGKGASDSAGTNIGFRCVKAK